MQDHTVKNYTALLTSYKIFTPENSLENLDRQQEDLLLIQGPQQTYRTVLVGTPSLWQQSEVR